MKGEPGGKGHAPRKGADHKAYSSGHIEIFGERCVKHPSMKLNQFGMCERCNEIHWNEVLGEKEK
jgi:hypothetical protein